jgi:hypothetical protein
VPEFEDVLNDLQPNEISEPLVSRFGVHLIQLLERRQATLSQREQRDIARNLVREKEAGRGVHGMDSRGARPRLRRVPRSSSITRQQLPMKHIARKRFGQHFLADAGVIDAIVRVIAPRARPAHGGDRPRAGCADAAAGAALWAS